jgi:molybdopterin-containing oxidoreductase family membrane subunit
MAMSVAALTILFVRRLRENSFFYYSACLMAVIGIWIEKGMGLIIPGFIPTPLGDLVEYTPSSTEIWVCLGIWSIGALLFTVLSKVAIAIQTGRLRESADPARRYFNP